MGSATLSERPIAHLAADFHVRLRKARRHAGLTQGDIAAAAGVSRNAVTHWEHPEGTRPTLTHLSSVAQVTGVAFEWLCTGRGRMRFQAEGDREEAAVILRYCAQDETEERILLDLRRLSYPQVLAIAQLVSSLAEDAMPHAEFGFPARAAAAKPRTQRT
jgi:transcriptional regulator with XRE-family HTH domain